MMLGRAKLALRKFSAPNLRRKSAAPLCAAPLVCPTSLEQGGGLQAAKNVPGTHFQAAALSPGCVSGAGLVYWEPSKRGRDI